MSRRTVSNHPDLQQIIGNSFTNNENCSHRALLVIELAPPGWLMEFARTRNIVCITTDTYTDQSDRITALLGSEHHILAHEISDPMDASLMAALAGTVTFSGVLILAIPFALTDNHSLLIDDSNDVQTRSITQRGTPTSFFSRRFTRLLAAAEKNHPNNIILATYQTGDKISDDVQTPLPSFYSAQRLDIRSHELTLAQQEQDSLLRSACEQLTTAESSCISIIGKRGRGKSALTARIANWMHERQISYRITAVHRSALSTFHTITNHPSQENFIPIQEIQKCAVDTLLVDEASNMPLGLLQELMIRHNQLILCTTVEGYESSGRAFELRMQATIRQNFNSQLLLSPKEPWRWLTDDPIESVIDALVLNDNKSGHTATELSDSNMDGVIDENTLRIRKITQQQLFDNEQELENVFTLLRDTHYQTTVKDLQHLLDGNEVLLWVLEEKNTQTLIAALLLTTEPGIEPSLHEPVLLKQRRLPHRLLTQLLAQTANTTVHLASDFARVVRISVAQNRRRRGFGSKLLKHVEKELLNTCPEGTCVKAIGASFANDSASVKFWRRNGYTTFHKGYRKNPRTGKHAVAVLKSQDATICKSLETASRIIADNQAWRLADIKSTHSASESQKPNSQSHDQELLEQFSKGYRSVHDTYAALSRLSLKRPLSLDMQEGVSRKRFENILRDQVSSILKQA
jgi:tRNA(Met) cytidine acetyltransferase